MNNNSQSISTTVATSKTLIGRRVQHSAWHRDGRSNVCATDIYTVYTDSACTTAATTQISGQPGTVTVTNGSVPDSAVVTFNTAGTYYFQDRKSVEEDNKRAVSGCT